MLQKMIDAPLKMEVTLMKCDTSSNCWIVQAIDMSNEGSVFTTHFEGQDCEARANEYAAFKYGA